MEDDFKMCNKYEGKTVDEAIFRGLNELEISIDEVDVEIIQTETKGVLGIGKKPAIVMLKRREMPREFAPEPIKRAPRAPRSDRPQHDRRPQRTERHGAQDAYERRTELKSESFGQDMPDMSAESMDNEAAQAENRYHEDNYSNAGEYRRHNSGYNRERSRGGYSNNDRYSNGNRQYNTRPEVNYTEEAVEESAAVKFVSELLANMGLNTRVTAANGENEQRVNIESEESAALLIGKRGETLDAIQYLTALVVNRECDDNQHIKVSVDVDGYRQRRYEKLVRTARAKASMVKSTGRDYSFEPMTAFDRRIIHYALQRNPFVTTHSEGEEPNRYVIISAKRRPRRY